ncbi:hypothetical protein [Streptomyces solincola]|uniref:hypothetical protein n=1 Tax=Streptomyces solincola TaxID=2100817 RepID=UPI0026D76A25
MPHHVIRTRRTVIALASAAAFVLTADPAPAVQPSTAADAGSYYAAAEGKTGPALKTALHTIIRSQSKVTYDQVWDALKTTDEDPANPANVIEL